MALANMLGRAEMRARIKTGRFDHDALGVGHVGAIVRMMDGLSDAEAERYFRRMIGEAEPGDVQVVSKFVDDVRAARSARPS